MEQNKYFAHLFGTWLIQSQTMVNCDRDDLDHTTGWFEPLFWSIWAKFVVKSDQDRLV